MEDSFEGRQHYVERLNRLRRYLPFLNYMVNEVKTNATQSSIERQIEKFRIIRALLADIDCPSNWNLVVSVEDVIRRLVYRLNYTEPDYFINFEFPSGQTGRNDFPTRRAFTLMNNAVRAPRRNSYRPPRSSTATFGPARNNPGSPRMTNRGYFRPQRTSTVTLASMLNNSDSSRATENDCSRPTEPTSAHSGSTPLIANVSNAQDVEAENVPKNLFDIPSGNGAQISKVNNMSPIPVQDSTTGSNTRRRKNTNFDNLDDHSNSDGNATYSSSSRVPETTPQTDSLSSSRGTPEQSRPSTSQETFSQSLKSHTNINYKSQPSKNNYYGFITFMSPRALREFNEKFKESGRCGVKPDSIRKQSEKGHVNPDKETVSQCEGSSSSLPDVHSRTRLSDRSSPGGYKSQEPSKDSTGSEKESGSKEDDALERMEVTSQGSSRPTCESEGEISRTSLTSEKDKRHSTGSEKKADLFENEKGKPNDENLVEKTTRQKIYISSLNDEKLIMFVRDNNQALPHLATLKASEIREALKALGIESYEEASGSSSEDESTNKFLPSTQVLLQKSKLKISEMQSRVLNTEDTTSIQQAEEGDTVQNTNPVEVSGDAIVSRSDDNNPEGARNDNKKDFNRDTLDEFRPDTQPSRNAEPSQLSSQETGKTHEGTPRMEPAKLSVPSEESNVNKADHVKPSENVRTRMSLRRHSLHSTTVQSTPSYRTKDIVYGNWLASALPSTISPLQGSNLMTQPNPRLTAASSSQSHQGMLNPMDNINLGQMISNPRFQRPSLLSPPLINTKPENDGKVSNLSQPSEAKSYAEYKRLKQEEMRKLRRKSPSTKPKTSPESGVGGRLASGKNVSTKTQVNRSPESRRCDRNHSPRGGKAMTSPEQRRHSDHGDSWSRFKENPNERARKDEDRKKKTDGEKAPADPEETISSPLDKLYEGEPKFQTGRGYGLQHFKIPKKVRSDTSGNRNPKFPTEIKSKSNEVGEVWNRPEESSNPNEHGGSSSWKGDGSRDLSEQTPNRSNKNVSPKGEDKTHLKRTTESSKNDKGTNQTGRENRDSLQQATIRTRSSTRASDEKGQNRDIPKLTEKSNKDGGNACQNVEENLKTCDKAAINKQFGKGKSDSREATANTTENKDGDFHCREAGASTKDDDNGLIENLKPREATKTTRGEDDNLVETDSRETTANTRAEKRDMISHVEGKTPSREVTETTRGEDDNTRGNLDSRETITNTEEDKDEGNSMGLNDLEKGTEANDKENNGVEPEHPMAHHQELENLNDENDIEREESSNPNSNDVETTKVREHSVQICDSSIGTPLGETSNAEQEEEELTNMNPVVSEDSVTGEEVESIVEEPLDGSAQNDDDEVTKSKNESKNEMEKSSLPESEKNKIEGEAAENETKTKTEKSDALSDPLASTSNQEESKQCNSSVTNTKKRCRRSKIGKTHIGTDIIPLKRNMKIRRKRGRKHLSTSESAEPEKEGTDNLESEMAEEPTAKKKRKGKAKTELDRLHDDIRSMFISSDVVKATGQRTCRMLRECLEKWNNAENLKEKAKVAKEKLKKKGNDGSSPSTSRRNTNSNDASPNDTVTRETHPNPVVDEYKILNQWPRVVLHRIDLDNFGYGTKVSDDCITFSRLKGSNKAIRSCKTWISKPSTSSINNEGVLRGIESKKPKKSTKKGSKGKKKTRTGKSKAVGMKQTKEPETCEQKDKKKKKNSNQEKKSADKVSRTERRKTVECQGDDSLLDYSYQKTQEQYTCKICSKVSNHITFHYKRAHPESEVIISRLSRTEAANALREAAENDFEDNFLEDTPLDMVRNILLARLKPSSEYCCRMCDRPVVTDVNSFFSHVSRHTGEYRFQCPVTGCGLTAFSRGSIKRHIGARHCDDMSELEGEVITLFPVPEELGYLYGYICSKCNFVQIFRRNLEKHIKKQHRGDKNIAIIKINLSSETPTGEVNQTVSSYPIVQRVITYVRPTEHGIHNNDNTVITELGEARKGFENRLPPIKLNMISKREGDFGLSDDGNGDEQVESDNPLGFEELETQIEVDDHSYTFKPERDLEPDSEANFEGNLEFQIEVNSETNWQTLIKEDFEVHPEMEQELYQEMHLGANSEPILETHLEAHSLSSAEQYSEMDLKPHLEMNLVGEPMELDGCADLSEISSIRGSDIIDPLESSDSIEEIPLPTPRFSVERVVVGPLEAQLLNNSAIFYECFIKGCVCKTTSYPIFEKHLKISHANTAWDGKCEICMLKGRDQRPLYLKLAFALKHLELHARQRICERELRQTEMDLLASNNRVLRENLNETGETDNFYPLKPLLRVRNLLGDRLSTPKEQIQLTTQQDSVLSIVREEPIPTCFTEENAEEEGFIKIQDIRSLNPEHDSEIIFEEVVSPVNTVREQVKVVTGQPVVVRSCPTRQITIRPDTSVLPIEVGHLQAVQTPVSNSSVVVSPLTDFDPVNSGPIVLGQTPNTTPIRIVSSMRPQAQTTRFNSQSVTVSSWPLVRSPTQIVCPTPTPTTSSQAVTPSGTVMEPEPEASTSSMGPYATTPVEQPVASSYKCSVKISIPRVNKAIKMKSSANVIRGPTVPPSLPGEIGVESSSLQMRSVLPFGNKTVKVNEIYKSMLTKEKLCDLFKCMASECSFTSNNQTAFDEHIKEHEADKKNSKSIFMRKGKKVYSWQQCSYCCETVAEPISSLSQHILNVHGHCTYQCAYCFFRAICVSYVNVHQSLAHLDKAKVIPRKIYKCKQLLDEPIYPDGWCKQSKRKFVRPYHCDQCGKKYLMTQEFMDHLVSEHSSVTAYMCHICKNLCFKADRLIAHYKLHSYSVYQCCFCLHATEIEWEMVVHLCQFHFTQHACTFMRTRTGGSNEQKWDADLKNLKLVTYDENVSSNCVVEFWHKEELEETFSSVQVEEKPEEKEEEDDYDEDNHGNLVINESQDINTVPPETGIGTESDSNSANAIMQELASLVKHSSTDVPFNVLWPNARFSSEGDSGSETVLISSGLSAPQRMGSTTPESVENYNMNIPLEQTPLKTSNHQIPVTSQPVMVPRFDVNIDGTVQSSRMVFEAMETPQATTSSRNSIMEPEIITPNVNPLPPATHRLPPMVPTTRTGAVSVRLPTERLTAPTVRIRQVEEAPDASSHEAEVSCEQKPDEVDSFQEEFDINLDSSMVNEPEFVNVPCSLSPSLQGDSDGNNAEEVESSSDETCQESQDPIQEVTNEDDASQDNGAEASKENDSEKNTTEEASEENLPRTRFSALRRFYRREATVKRNVRNKSAATKKANTDLTGESLWICGRQGCNFTAPDEQPLVGHMIDCDNSCSFPLLTCPHCGKLFKQNSSYVEHLKIHGEKKFFCGLCEYKTALESSIIRHAKHKHRSKQLKTYPTEPPKEGCLVYYPKNYKKEKYDFKATGYSPGDVDKLPLQAVYQVNVKCAKCPYFTKVRSNMVRHLNIHQKSTETEGVVVPSTAPTNPVPCLDAKEKMFDKMTNLAASSQLAQAKEKSAPEKLTPEEIDKLPQFINEQVRYKCCLPDCKYSTVNETILKHHIRILHAEVTCYSCPHCSSHVREDVRNVTLDKMGFHLRHHDFRLYKCAYCVYFHYQKAVVEKHTLEKHSDRRYFVHTVREPSAEDGSSTGDSSEPVWKCGLCQDFQSLNRPSVMHHLAKIHGTKSMYKCQLCDMKTSLCHLFNSHYSSKHPGEEVSFISTIIRGNLSSSESAALSESTTDHFDTTPLWQRGASRVRHIRGILIEEEEVSTKKSKKIVDQTEHTPSTAPSTSSTRAPPPCPTPAPAPPTATARSLTTTTTTITTTSPIWGPSPTRAPTSTSPQAPTRSQASTPAPAPTSVPTRAPIPAKAPTSIPTHAPTPTPTPARALAPTLILFTTPVRVSTSTPTRAPAPVPAPPRGIILFPTPTSTPVGAPIPAPAPNSGSVSTSACAPALTHALVSSLLSPPAQAQVPGTSAATTRAQMSENLERMAVPNRQQFEQRLTGRHSRKKSTGSSESDIEKEMADWVNNIIEQERNKLERKRQRETSGDESESSQSSPKKRKTTNDNN